MEKYIIKISLLREKNEVRQEIDKTEVSFQDGEKKNATEMFFLMSDNLHDSYRDFDIVQSE